MRTILSMTVFWIYIRLAVLLIVLTSILSAVLVNVDLSGLRAFNDLFNIFP